jgi:hypothetical protein
MTSIFQHELDGDIPVGEAWVNQRHLETNVEVIGPPRQGKTTLVEWLILGLTERVDTGILHIDPTGDSYRKILGWLADGRLSAVKSRRPIWLVDLDEKVLRYNPLTLAKRDPAAFVPALYSALALINNDQGIHRQMARWVMNTLESLIALDLPFAMAERWLLDKDWRDQHMSSLDKTLQLHWSQATSGKLDSAVGWFDVFSRKNLGPMFSGDGFDWADVYDEQPFVLVNLGCRRLGGDIRFRKAVGALFITGLLSTAMFAPRKRRWHIFVDDATFYTPEHVGPILTESGHYKLFLTLIHHIPFDGGLQRLVDAGCLTKFYFGEYARMRLGRYQCAYVHDRAHMDYLNLEPTPEIYGRTDLLKTQVYDHPWYGEVKREEAAEPPRDAPRTGRPPGAPPPSYGAHQKSKKPGSRPGRRN